MYLYDFFSLFLGVQSAPEVDPTSYETPCIAYRKLYSFPNNKLRLSMGNHKENRERVRRIGAVRETGRNL